MATYDKKPKPGDLIEIFRSLYQHWGVYVGDGFIVHLASSSGVLGAYVNGLTSVPTKGIVKKEKLRDVVGTNRWEISNRLDEKYEPRSVHVIVSEACAKVGEELLYSLLTANCEHFANELRYGESESWQVPKAEEIVMGAAEALFQGGKKENVTHLMNKYILD